LPFSNDLIMKANSFINTGLQYGGIVGLVSVLYGVFGYINGPQSFTNWWVGILLWVFVITTLIIGVVQSRKKYSDSTGAFAFKSAFTVFVVGSLVATCMGVIFNILLFNFIDPGFKEEVADAIYEMTISMMERFGAPDDAIDEALAKADENDQFSIKNQLLSIPKAITFYAIVGLIVAAATKRKGRLFENSNSKES
jgi:hypothetical protein